MCSSSCCSCLFETEIIKIGQLSGKMFSNKIVNFQESTTIVNACIKKSGNLLNSPRIKGTGGLGNLRITGDHSSYFIIVINQNTEKSPGDLRRLAVTQTPLKDHQLTLM